MNRKAGHITSLIFLISIFVFLISMHPALALPSLGPASQQANSELLFTLPVGDGGIHYESPALPDSEAWGPTALAVGPNGNIWVADTVGNRLLSYFPDGRQATTVLLDDVVLGVNDLRVTSQGIWILDTSSQPAQFLQLDLSTGNLLNQHSISRRIVSSILGLSILGNGVAKIQYNDLMKAIPIKSMDTTGMPSTQSNPYPPIESPAASTQMVRIKGTYIKLPQFAETGSIRLLGYGSDGSIFLIVEEVITTDKINVDQTVRHFSPNGNLMGIARFPLDDQYTYVERNIALGPDGNIYALMTRPDKVEIHRLLFYQDLPSILPIAGDSLGIIDPSVGKSMDSPSVPQSPTCTISRDTIIANAAAYVNNSIYLSNTNITGNCPGRTKPRYLGNEGTYYSVPYDWGGERSLSQFRTDMTNNRQAGDIHTAGVESCSSGVDCSGFIARIWQLTTTTDWYTGNLPSVSTRLGSTAELRRGDILNNISTHVALYVSSETSGVRVYESTTYNSMDRVIYKLHPWSRYNGYSPYGLNTVCADGDPDDNRLIGSNQTLTGTVNPNTDVDTYYFDASQNQKATIRMARNGGSLDSFLILYAPNGSEIARNDDSEGTLNSLISNFTLPQNGRYKIIAKSYGGYTGGTYSLSLTLTSGVDYTPPPGYTLCAYENQRCSFGDTRDVAYGANGVFTFRLGLTGGVDCNNGVFGDPLYGIPKACFSKVTPPFSGTVSSALNITVTQARLDVCATNLPSRPIHATLYRGPTGAYGERLWRHIIYTPTNATCITFVDMDGAGDTLRGVTYYTVASTRPISDADAKARRTSCFTATSGYQLCDAKSR